MTGLYVRNKLFSSIVERTAISENTQIRALINRIGLPVELEEYLHVTHEGEYIPRDEWERMVTPHDIVRVSVVPAGGDGGGLFAALAGLALAVFAPYAAPFVAGALGVSTTVATVGIMFVGSLLLNAMFAPPSLKPGDQSDDSAGFLGVSGIKNQTRPHGAVRCIYGTYKVAPDVAAESYILTSGDVQTLYSLFDFGYGEIDVSSIEIGNTAIGKYAGAQYKIRKNYTNEALTYYKNDNVTDGYNTEIRNTNIARVAPSNESNEVTITIQFSMGLGYQYDKHSEFREWFAGFHVHYRKVSTGQVVNLYQTTYRSFSHATTQLDVASVQVARRTKQPFVFTITAGMPSSGEWEVNVYRTRWPIYYDRALEEDTYLDKTVLTSIRSTTYRKALDFATPHTIMEMRVTATDQLSGVVDNITAMCARRIPTWDGNSQVFSAPVQTSNPAWIALDLLRGTANPDAIPDTRIDLFSFWYWASYCDRMAAQGDNYYQAAVNWDARRTV
ncbi:hypothetical protein DRH27_00565, partial [Candidatus Falkowbacteria bacterium]